MLSFKKDSKSRDFDASATKMYAQWSLVCITWFTFTILACGVILCFWFLYRQGSCLSSCREGCIYHYCGFLWSKWKTSCKSRWEN